MPRELRSNNLGSGAAYFFAGVRMLLRPELRRYILIPLLVNCVIFITLTALVIHNFDSFTSVNWHLPEWLAFLEKTLKWVAWFLLVVILIIGYGYTFNIVTNVIAAPFYGLLAQKTEVLLTGEPVDDEPWLKMIPRTIGREIKKLFYFLTRGVFILLLMLLLGTIPLLNFSVPVVGTLWSAWCMAIQYVDYAADNHQSDFRRLRKKLRKQKYSSVGFGGMVMGCSMIPVVNIVVMPAAVVGGTLYWTRELRDLRRK